LKLFVVAKPWSVKDEKNMTNRLVVGSIVSLLLAIGVTVSASHLFRRTNAQNPSTAKPEVQDADKETDEQESRRMFRTFGNQRTRSTATRSKPAASNPVPAKSNDVSNSAAQDDAFIGFTVWEMREAVAGVERRKLTLKKSNGQNVVLRPFRLGLDTRLVAGRSYVFSVESARPGYLYVIDRELYANGSLGQPLLIFPTKDPSLSGNQIAAGYPIEIPNQRTETAYFEAEKNGQNHIGEALTIIVSSQPLIAESRLKVEPIALDSDELAKWEKQWRTRSRWADNLEATGRPYSEQEGKAGAEPDFKLKETDPLPQRLFRVDAKAESALMITLKLRYSEAPKPE
jgi:hypothetical protein